MHQILSVLVSNTRPALCLHCERVNTYNDEGANSESDSEDEGRVVALLVGVILCLPGATGHRQLIHGRGLEVLATVVAAHCGKYRFILVYG